MAEREELNRTRARQGSYGRPVGLVLLGGLILGALFVIGMMLFSTANTPTAKTDVGSPVQTGSVAKPGSASSGNTTPGPAKPAQ